MRWTPAEDQELLRAVRENPSRPSGPNWRHDVSWADVRKRALDGEYPLLAKRSFQDPCRAFRKRYTLLIRESASAEHRRRRCGAPQAGLPAATPQDESLEVDIGKMVNAACTGAAASLLPDGRTLHTVALLCVGPFEASAAADSTPDEAEAEVALHALRRRCIDE